MAKATDSVTVTISSWDKFNPRGDVKHSSWFRMEHSVFEDPKFYKLKPSDWGVFLYLCCQASKVGKGTFQVDFEHAKRVAQLTRTAILSVLEKLQASQFIHVDVTDANVNVTSTNANVTGACSTDGRTDGTDGAQEPASAPDPKTLLGVWNEEATNLPKAKGMGTNREKAAKARLAEHPELEYWREVIRRMNASPFCQGKRNRDGRKWKADFDFLLQPETQHKVLEGKYDESAGHSGPQIVRVEDIA